MNLDELLAQVPGTASEGHPEIEIAGITCDSRLIQPGGLFVAIRGTSDDGHRYLASAAEAGAVAAVGQDSDPGLEIPYFQAEDARLAYAHLAAAWHGYPARELVMIGITGTDGKTTTAMLLHEILARASLPAGLISTVSARIGDSSLDTGLHVTTPDPMDLQALLRQMVDEGLSHCVLEATSHGLAQHRVAACDFDVGVVTNITHEHLDFHGSYDAYRASKSLLISGLSESAIKSNAPEKTAVLNFDDKSYGFLKDVSQVRTYGYGMNPAAEVSGSSLLVGRGRIEMEVQSNGLAATLKSPMVGEYNASNMLAAFATASLALEIDSSIIEEGVGSFLGVPGRMEIIDLGQDFTAIVDFAHTPNALKEALTAARSLTDRRVISIFGSAGLRDRAKRWMMPEISAELADISILTAEDPRTEPLEEILQEMADGAIAKGGREDETFWRIPDRGDAIRKGLKLAEPGDLVILCGKGHEQSMCFGEVEYPWDDRTAMKAALAECLSIEGPEMPSLPTSTES